MTSKKFDRDEEHRIRFIRSRLGCIIWMGIRSDDKEVHGHGLWIIGKVERDKSGTVFVWIRNNNHAEWHRVALDQIVRAAPEEPGPKYRDFMREFDQGLSPPPKIDEILAEAARHQVDGDAGTR